MFPRKILTQIGLFTLLLGLAGPAFARDNFLIIVADDFGVDMVGQYSDDIAYGHPGEGANPGPTPRLDLLAQGGVLFRNAYTNSQCAPTRAQIMTGRHGLRTGVGTPGGTDLDLAETTIAELLSATHRRAAIGKWHLGGNDADHPIDQGFEYYAGALTNLNGDYYDWTKTINSEGGSSTTLNNHAVYTTDDNSAEAIAKIAEYGEDPWIVYLAFTAPHSPFNVPTGPLTQTVTQGSSNLEKYKAMVEAMDREIGDVIDSISPTVLADTTIIFIGDNGTPGSISSAGAGRAKGSMYEGGINVPLIISGPHAAVGQESLALVHSTDIFATIADIAGLESTAEDSLSMLPYMQDPSRGTNPARPYQYGERFVPNGFGPYTEHERALREDQYKLIWRDGVFEEFFDLVAHPAEDQNLLPYETMTEEQQAAYDRLVQRMDGVPEEGDAACPTRRDSACTTGYLKAKLDWKEGGGLADKVVVSLTKGPALEQIDYGNPVPTDGTAYAACFYDDMDILVAEMRVVRAGDLCSGKECWKAAGGDAPDGKGYKYKDKLGTSTGFLKLQVFRGDPEKSKVKFVGRGLNLPDGVTEALLGSTSATVQLRGSDATQCVSATVDDIAKQESDRFKATN